MQYYLERRMIWRNRGTKVPAWFNAYKDSRQPKVETIFVLKTEVSKKLFVKIHQNNHLNAKQIRIFSKISNAWQCLFPHFVRFVNWTLNEKLFLFWFSRWYYKGVISGSQMGLKLLQNMEIIKQTDILLWKIWRKFGSVSYLFSCNKLSKESTRFP